MKFSTIRRQRGVSVLAVFLLLGVAGLLIVLAARVTPTVLEYQAIQGAVEKARVGQTPDEVRRLFDRAAEVDGIKSISSKDLEITRDDSGRVVIGYAYDRQFSLGGPAFLLIKYSGKSI
ncbi:DUF4845 domain-containing protein [Ramlibacter rhizophilus]|uniref:DUF4845 domain-containing protein n=1 Tax=Ramlibacter rhizophilus TaxID=1781167 RepID=A0A4Z0BCP0_9BURK|nr:DUF4845 domain-containing protein [Ramlibacter rhizophilus]TFY96500.1 DUF4845 domain-containing protein [Ramlibacter rhizophilus]